MFIPVRRRICCHEGWLLSTSNKTGKIQFLQKDGQSFIVQPEESCVFDSEEYHDSEILEDSETIECFSPMRPEYADV